MRKILVLCGALALSGCASIISKSDWPVTFTSATPGTDFTVTDETGVVRVAAKTPTTVTLPAGHNWFGKMTYTVQSELGTRTLNPSINGWYFGNLIFGGPLGLIFIDPATGAMFKLPGTFDLVEPPKRKVEQYD
jgi:uncharacterized protein YceK